MLWIPIRRTLVRRVWCAPTTYFLMEKEEKLSQCYHQMLLLKIFFYMYLNLTYILWFTGFDWLGHEKGCDLHDLNTVAWGVSQYLYAF